MQRYPEDLAGVGQQYERTLGTVHVCLAPIVPMFASELWAGFAAAPPLARLAALDPRVQTAQSPSRCPRRPRPSTSYARAGTLRTLD